ncbi:hypothetical protein Pyn_25628 [Prunus yedoensis var. nudiflora]|uniref:Uncharacterized protein n=1 Tax=Prunus yedoensis var. nudiflora TaxID=2094558 RepID=A0A314UX89_PRUYE|nr:hypothetical protein Pyn_25628 [Prunus yedoensis var. nudiflora]
MKSGFQANSSAALRSVSHHNLHNHQGPLISTDNHNVRYCETCVVIQICRMCGKPLNYSCVPPGNFCFGLWAYVMDE